MKFIKIFKMNFICHVRMIFGTFLIYLASKDRCSKRNHMGILSACRLALAWQQFLDKKTQFQNHQRKIFLLFRIRIFRQKNIFQIDNKIFEHFFRKYS